MTWGVAVTDEDSELVSERQHFLKCWPNYYPAVLRGDKTVELRINDRAYEVGDILVICEYDRRKGYTGRQCRRIVTHVLVGSPEFGMSPDYVALSMQPVE